MEKGTWMRLAGHEGSFFCLSVISLIVVSVYSLSSAVRSWNFICCVYFAASLRWLRTHVHNDWCGVPCCNDDVSLCECVTTSSGFGLRCLIAFSFLVSDKLGLCSFPRHSHTCVYIYIHTHTHTHTWLPFVLLSCTHSFSLCLITLCLSFSPHCSPSLPVSCLSAKGDWFVLRLIHLY